MTPSPTEAEVLAALKAFLIAILPVGTKVVRGTINRVAEPAEQNFVVVTPQAYPRISTNFDAFADAAYAASIAGATMTVTSVERGQVVVGAQLFGAGVTDGTLISAQLSGTPGGIGTYTVAPPQTVASATLASGAKSAKEAARWDVQLDFHGPQSGDGARVFATLFRDPFGTEFFEALGIDAAPLYAGEPAQRPFVNAEQQYEWRWIVEAALQVNQTVAGLPQQFASVVSITPVSAETLP